MSEPTKKKQQDFRTALEHMCAGSLARMTAAIAMCPADTIKTRMQFAGKLKNVKQYTSVWDAVTRIPREEGVMAFTRGLPARLIYVAPAAGVSFFFYENLVSAVRTPDASKNPVLAAVLPFVGISLARVAGTTLRTPFDVVKQRMQIQGSLNKKLYKHSFDATIKIARQEGFRGMFRGTHVALARDAPFAAAYFSTYEFMKDVQRVYLGKASINDLSIVNALLGGAIAGAVATTLTNPMDVVKTRLQTQSELPEERRYRGVIDAFFKIAKEEGARGLMRGYIARVLYVTPSAAIVWGSYEQYKKLIHKLFNP